MPDHHAGTACPADPSLAQADGALIRQYYNSTFLKKRTEARIGAASVLLKTTELPVGEIAEMTGYSSSEHFSYAFKTYTGMSAREFRRKSSFEAGPRPLSENVF
ncbi:AraC family transcriptional regulator [Hungatella hathewayi]|nr:AraC family transcriptional regulator [Hungatella hathewayi]